MTGSVNQHGQVQAIGGVNEKVEGFFDICKAKGLTGKQGVLIPAANVKHLMLRADVVGPVCETGDYLALNRELAEPKPGDLLAVMSAGAYGAVQAGTYNTRPLVPEVLVKGDKWALIRPRLEVDALIALDRLPDWL